METRKNTVKLVFATSARVPIHLDVLRFMMRVLKIPATDVHSVYKDENDQRFYVKFIDENSFNRFSSTMEEQYWFEYADGEKIRVQLEMASRQFKYVRIFNLPPETEDKDIAAVLGQFGRIRQHVRERYPADYGYQVFSGVRGVHIEIEKEIPANLYIGHFRARCYYEGLKNKCFFCKAEGHNKANCPKLAEIKEKGVSGPANSRMYSQVPANLRIATSSSENESRPSSSMTVLQVPRHPSAGKIQERGEKATPRETIGTCAEQVSAENVAEIQPAQIDVQDSHTNDGDNAGSMETDDTSRAHTEENGVKRPPATTSENDSSDVEKGKGKGRGRKKKQHTGNSSNTSRSRSRGNSRGSF